MSNETRTDIPIAQVVIEKDDAYEKRCRTDFDDVPSLAASIAEVGLLHPIVVELMPAIEGAPQLYKLIAGERRLRACIFLGWSVIPATIREISDAVKRKTIELEENIKRKDLSWPEQIEALRQLHELRQISFGAKTSSPADNASGWGVRETAKTLGFSTGKIAQELSLANSLKNNPELLSKVSHLPKHAAARIVKQILERRRTSLQVASGEIALGIELRLGNCLDLIDAIPDDSVKLLLTDPPFAEPDIVKAATTSTAAYNVNESNVSDSATMLSIFKVLYPKLARKLKVGAHVYIFSGMGEMYAMQMLMLKQAGFLMDSLPLIWDKGMTSTIARDFHYMSTYQAVLFGHNQERTFSLWKPVGNILHIKAIAHQSRVHPLQLPEELLELLIKNSSDPGDLILDCFAGSGAVLKTAKHLNRRAIGFELDSANYSVALKWIEKDD